MNSILTADFIAALITGAILAGMPLLLAALGETISEQAGLLNIGLEGMMLLGAYAGFVVANWTGSSWLGFLAAIVAGMAVAMLMVVFCVRMGRDQIVVGIAILLSMEGLTSLLHAAQFGESYPRLDGVPTVAIPGLSKIPVLGTEHLQPAADRLHRLRADLRGRLDALPDQPRPQHPRRGVEAGGARQRRRGRAQDPHDRRADRPALWPVSAAATWPSSPPASSCRS